MKKLFALSAAFLLAAGLHGQEQITTPELKDIEGLTPIGFSDVAQPSFCASKEGSHSEGIGYWRDYYIYDANLTQLFSVTPAVGETVIETYVINATLDFSEQPGFRFTQKLLNNDNGYEYFLARNLSNGSNCKTICIYSSMQSEPIATINADGDNEFSNKSLHIVYFGDDKPLYFIISNKYSSDYKYTSSWYKWDRATSGIRKVGKEEAEALAAYPNPVKVGTTVSFSADVTEGECAISVYSMSGQLVRSVNSSAATLDTTGMTAGNYIYTLTTGGKPQGSGKLILY